MAEVEENMEELMKRFEAENGITDVSDADDDGVDDDEPMNYDELLEKFRRDVNPQENEIDHLVLGVSDLDKAVDDFEEMTGVRPVMVVSHKGLGTKSARVAFQSCCFVEILGPDPKQSSTPLAKKLSELPSGKMVPVHYAVRNKQSDDTKKKWRDMGLEIDQVTMIAVDQGMPWKWNLCFLENHDDGGLVPFFADWGDAHHAAGRLPIVGNLKEVTVSAPGGSVLHKVLKDVDGVDIETGEEKLEFSFTSSKGTHTFSSSDPVGLEFPK
jgi:catechol 2,3-dioxygenase-like lactoylglutathione lyase family enzyme